MSSKNNMAVLKTPIQQKAIQKFPFTLNNKTYFSSECFYDDIIINGISLQLKQAKGLSDDQQTVSYLNYSNRLIYYAGANIISYNLYKRKYQIIQHSQNFVRLKAFSLSSIQKQYIGWVQKSQKKMNQSFIQNQKPKCVYCVCMQDLTKKAKIYDQKFLSVDIQAKPENIEIIAFMDPHRIIGLCVYNQQTNQTSVFYKKAVKSYHQQVQFGDQCSFSLPFKFKNFTYDVQSNSYLFMKNQYQIWALRCISDSQDDDSKQFIDITNQDGIIKVDKLISINANKLGQKKILHFAVGQTYLVILVSKQNDQRDLQFYSIFSYAKIFTQNVWQPPLTAKKSQRNIINGTQKNIDRIIGEQNQNQSSTPIDYIQFNKTIIIGVRNNSQQVSIFSLYQQNLKHIRNTVLDLDNCFKIQRLFINSFSSQVMILSKHYELDSDITTTTQRSNKYIRKSQSKYKRFYFQISSFFITMQASIVNVQKLSLQKRNYCCILTCPWMSQFLIQTQNSLKNKRWQQRFDCVIRCSAIHPTSQYVALGFNDCFKIYFLTYEGLIHTFVTQNVKQCTSVAYSKTGNDFAVATNFSIYIYDSYTYQKKHQIFLGMSYKIEQINYIEGQENEKPKQCLQCVTHNKRTVFYNVDCNYKQQFAFNPKNHIQNTVINGFLEMADHKKEKNIQFDLGQSNYFIEQKNSKLQNTNNTTYNKRFGAILYDQKTRVVVFSLGNKINFISAQNFQSLGSFDFQQISCIQLCRSLKTMFLGTASGKIIAFPWPNKPINITSRNPTYEAHKTRIKRIKVSSNLFELVSITQQSMYIHSITMIEQMRKIHKYELQRQSDPKSALVIDFFLKAGICLFTFDKYEQKCEKIKQNEQQAVNFNFILPEERQKQKMSMLDRLQVSKMKLTSEVHDKSLPLKLQSLNFKEKVKYLHKQLKANSQQYQSIIQKQVQMYQKSISELSLERDGLRRQYFKISKDLQNKNNTLKDQLRRQLIKCETVHRMKLEQANRQTKRVDQQRQLALNDFHQLKQIDEQKKILNNGIISGISKQISVLLQRNGYLMCRNANMEKQISTRKRKIEDIKQLIQNIQQNIKRLPSHNRALNRPSDQREQNTINKQFAQAQKKYLKETKNLIQKNKAVNVSIQLYQRERQMLIILQKRLEKQQQSIDQIVEYISNQREHKLKIKEKVSFISQKVKKIAAQYEVKNTQRIRYRNVLKQYLYNITLYQEGVINLQKLKQISQIQPQDMVKPPQNIQLSIEQKKKKIGKIESAEQKIMNVMKNERKIYSNQKRKTCMHNQDLLVNFNFLLHQNKYLLNLMKDQKEKKKYFIKNNTHKKDNRKLVTKATPFQSYLQFKTYRRTKTSPFQQYDLQN